MANFLLKYLENLENFEKKKSAFQEKKACFSNFLVKYHENLQNLGLTILTNWLKKVKFWVPFPANPSQIPPTFRHGNKVKAWKFEKKKKIPNLSFVWRERGRKEEKSGFAKK